jgi:hypothetical protein
VSGLIKNVFDWFVVINRRADKTVCVPATSVVVKVDVVAPPLVDFELPLYALHGVVVVGASVVVVVDVVVVVLAFLAAAIAAAAPGDGVPGTPDPVRYTP